eukprot:753713-Hanusia_phi.AAC.6
MVETGSSCSVVMAPYASEGAPDGSGAGEGGGMDIWSEGRMSRKRKHSEICGMKDEGADEKERVGEKDLRLGMGLFDRS